MYVYIRAALLAVVMEEMAMEKGENWAPKVVAIGGNKVTEYTGHGKRELSIEEALPASKRSAHRRKQAKKKDKRKA